MRLASLVTLSLLLGCSTANAQVKKTNQSDPLIELLKSLGNEPKASSPSSVEGTIELGEINRSSVQDTIAKLQAVKAAGATTAYIRINSPGGSVTAGQELSQVIETLGIPVVCIGDSNVESMAYYILQSCTERWATKRTVFMIHPPSFHGIDGNPDELAATAEELEVLANAMVEHEASRMKISVEQLKAKIAHHAWFFNWDEAIKVGAVDKIVVPKDIPPDIEWNQLINL